MKKVRTNRIALTGLKQSGKDTTAKYLIKEYGFERYAIADPLKEVCRVAFNFTQDQLYGDLKEIPDPRWNNITPRKVFQVVGTEMFQSIDDYIPELKSVIHPQGLWLHRFKIEFDQAPKDKRWVITDCRFKTEEEYLRGLGFEIWRVEKVYTEQQLIKPDLPGIIVDDHASEKEILSIKEDHVIKNVHNNILQGLIQVDELLLPKKIGLLNRLKNLITKAL